MSTLRAILIDPVAKMVTEVVVENTLEAYYRLLRCETIEAAYPRGMPALDHLYVDEEGLFQKPQHFFMMSGYAQPLAGRALVVGDDGEGNTTSAVTTLKEMQLRIRFQP